VVWGHVTPRQVWKRGVEFLELLVLIVVVVVVVAVVDNGFDFNKSVVIWLSSVPPVPERLDA
jgi:hypothetical protein